jgi:hypothetical protein
MQDDISAMQNTLEEEREKRKELTAELEEKEQKVQELIENESRTLGDVPFPLLRRLMKDSTTRWKLPTR